MEKALEYLYRMKELNEQMGEEPINIIEAIKELESLQNNSCEGCSNYRTYADGLKHCILYEGYFDFFCSRGHWIDDYYNKGIDYYKDKN